MAPSTFRATFTRLVLVLVAGFWLLETISPLPAYGSRWEYLKTYEGVDLYQALQASEGSLPFRATADLDVPYQKIVMALVDVERKNMWAPKLKSTAIHSQLSANKFEYSEYYTTPWPFKDREFLLLGTISYQPNQVLFAAVDSRNQGYVREDHVRANIEFLEFAVIPLSEEKTRVQFTFSGDLGGWIPSFVKTIIQKKWPVRFIQSLQRRIQTDMTLESARYRALQKGPLTIPETNP
jgi:hypothetical protein